MLVNILKTENIHGINIDECFETENIHNINIDECLKK